MSVITVAGVFFARNAVTTNNGKNIVYFVAHLNIIYIIYNITLLCQIGVLYLFDLKSFCFSVLASPPKAEHVSEAVFFTVLLAGFRRRGAGGAPERKKCNE